MGLATGSAKAALFPVPMEVLPNHPTLRGTVVESWYGVRGWNYLLRTTNGRIVFGEEALTFLLAVIGEVSK